MKESFDQERRDTLIAYRKYLYLIFRHIPVVNLVSLIKFTTFSWMTCAIKRFSRTSCPKTVLS